MDPMAHPTTTSGISSNSDIEERLSEITYELSRIADALDYITDKGLNRLESTLQRIAKSIENK